MYYENSFQHKIRFCQNLKPDLGLTQIEPKNKPYCNFYKIKFIYCYSNNFKKQVEIKKCFSYSTIETYIHSVDGQQIN